jgi:hypothetical protein
MPKDHGFWFPAKRYGWGWGIPTMWQGWVVLAAFVLLVVVGAFAFPPAAATFEFVAYVLVLNVLLVCVCWLTGEPPRWRWGNDRK